VPGERRPLLLLENLVICSNPDFIIGMTEMAPVVARVGTVAAAQTDANQIVLTRWKYQSLCILDGGGLAAITVTVEPQDQHISSFFA